MTDRGYATHSAGAGPAAERAGRADLEPLKQAAAWRAVEAVRSGMVVGLGSGTTARYATLRIAERLRCGELGDIVAIPTSDETATLAREAEIPLTTLD
ncbi:MAG: hypothetical protein GX557_07430, partial [Chloroflexi bacterium]|nr:hypothetical protein [Chloroflexota bacterium]